MTRGAEREVVSDEMDLREIAVTVWRKRWWIFASMIISTATAIVIAFTMTPVYRASIVLIPVGDRGGALGGSSASLLGSLGGIASFAGLNINRGPGEVEEALAILQSRQFIEGFIQSHDLQSTILDHRTGLQYLLWPALENEGRLSKVSKYFSEEVLSVVRDNQSPLVTVRIDWIDSNQAAEWANELVDRLNSELRARALERTQTSLGFLEAELGRTTVIGVQSAISRLIEEQISKRMLANVTEEYALRVVDRAMAPDQDDRLRPNRKLIIVFGLIAGGLVGLFGVLVATVFVSQRSS